MPSEKCKLCSVIIYYKPFNTAALYKNLSQDKSTHFFPKFDMILEQSKLNIRKLFTTDNLRK